MREHSPERALRLGAPPRRARVVAGALDEHARAHGAAELERARAEGREAGYAAAVAESAGALERAAAELDRRRAEAEEQLAAAAVDLSLAVARELLAIEVPRGGYDLERIVRDCLAASGTGRGACTVHLHPSDAERLRDVPFRSGLVVDPDPSLRRGDVQLTTPHGVLVRELDGLLEAIAERLRREVV